MSILQRVKNNYKKNKDKIAEYKKNYNLNNREVLKVVKALYRDEHKEAKKHIVEREKATNWTDENYKLASSNQNNKCLICGRTTVRQLSADHDHSTGQIRGLLCNNCNSVIGFANDNVYVLWNAIKYLLYFKQFSNGKYIEPNIDNIGVPDLDTIIKKYYKKEADKS